MGTQRQSAVDRLRAWAQRAPALSRWDPPFDLRGAMAFVLGVAAGELGYWATGSYRVWFAAFGVVLIGADVAIRLGGLRRARSPDQRPPGDGGSPPRWRAWFRERWSRAEPWPTPRTAPEALFRLNCGGYQGFVPVWLLGVLVVAAVLFAPRW